MRGKSKRWEKDGRKGETREGERKEGREKGREEETREEGKKKEGKEQEKGFFVVVFCFCLFWFFFNTVRNFV